MHNSIELTTFSEHNPIEVFAYANGKNYTQRFLGFSRHYNRGDHCHIEFSTARFHFRSSTSTAPPQRAYSMGRQGIPGSLAAGGLCQHSRSHFARRHMSAQLSISSGEMRPSPAFPHLHAERAGVVSVIGLSTTPPTVVVARAATIGMTSSIKIRLVAQGTVTGGEPTVMNATDAFVGQLNARSRPVSRRTGKAETKKEGR